MNKEELLKMAREAGFGIGQEIGALRINGYADDLQRFACAILERAAVECERSFFGDAGELNHEIAEAIRALKL